MFNKISYSDDILKFHTSESASQCGASVALRQASIAFTTDSVTLGNYGPFALPPELKSSKGFREILDLNGGSFRVAGISRSPRKRPSWPILTYAYRLYLHHEGIATSDVLPPQISQMIEAKRTLWNTLIEHCEDAIEAGQSVTREVIDVLAKEVILALASFNDSLGRSKDKIPFPKDDPDKLPAQRLGAYARFLNRLHHLHQDRRPVPDGLEGRIAAFLKQYPYSWEPFRKFEKSIDAIGREIALKNAIPDSIAAHVIQSYRACFKRRRTMKLKGFDGIPRVKSAKEFNWVHEFSFGSGGVKVARFMTKGTSSIRLGRAEAPERTGHPLMNGRKSTKRSLLPVTFDIEGNEITFAMMMHRPLPENALLKRWRLVHREGQYWVNFMLEIPPYVEETGAAPKVAGLDLNWRVLPDRGIMIGMLTDGEDDTMIVVDMNRSSAATDDGGMLQTGVEGGFRIVSMGVGPSRWGRNNTRKGRNFGIADTLDGLRAIRQLRDKAKDDLKIRIEKAMGGQTPSHLSACGVRGLKKMADEVEENFPAVADEIRGWATKDQDLYRVLEKASRLLDGRMERGYEQLARYICRNLAQKGIRRISMEETFLEKIAEAEKKYQPVALQKSARYRQAVGLSRFINILSQIGAKFGITLDRNHGAYTTTKCRFCGEKCEFGQGRTAQCPGCSRLIDQDQNAAHNLRNIGISLLNGDVETAGTKEDPSTSARTPTWTLTIGRISINGELKQKRDLLLSVRPQAAIQSSNRN